MGLYFLKLCWKNIWRNRRRTLLTVTAIGTGVAALVGIHNYYDGFHEQVVHNVIRYHSGHLLVSAPGYQEQNNPSKYLKDVTPLETLLAKEAGIKHWSTRVLVQGLLSSSAGSANILYSGVDPERERNVTRFAASLVQGKYLEDTKRKTIVVGSRLAKLLNLSLGSKVVALTQGVDGSIGNELFYVEGIFETQSELDKSLAFLRLENARGLLSLTPAGAHQVAIVLKNETELPAVRARLERRIPKGEAEVLSWMDIQRPLMALIELNKSVNRLLMAIILCIAAMGIANSILMSILERTREFGVMMAIGTTKHEVIKMVLAETMLLSLVGVVAGNILGILLTVYFGHYGFDLKWLTSQEIVVQGTIIQTISYPKVIWANSAVVASAILVLSAMVSFIPIRHIANLNAVKALRAH